MTRSGLRDNHQRGKVCDFIERSTIDGSNLAIVTAYFTVFAYMRMQPVFDRAPKVRLLFGDPAFIGGFESQPGHAMFTIQDEAVSLATALEQKSQVAACRDWFANHVDVRSVIEPGFLHGKMIHISTEHAAHAIVGSSNFTVRGLGLAADNNNVELNLIASDDRDRADLLDWFEQLWENDTKVKDVKADVLAHLDRFYEDQSPEFIYQKTLYHVFGSQLQSQDALDETLKRGHFKQSAVWQMLFDFQRQGALSAIRKLLDNNGCILADSVGLGKTLSALAIIKYFENRNENVLVLAPKKLEQNWREYRDNVGTNPLLADRFRYDLMFHTDMGRSGKTADGRDLAQWNWCNYDLIVIDESHNFRNNRISADKDKNETRYEFLMKRLISEGVRSKVLLLSATPVNNSLKDLRNQISLIVGADASKDRMADACFAEPLGVTSIHRATMQAQKRFIEWTQRPAKERHKKDLLSVLGGDFTRLLDGLTIARSRAHIKRFFGGEMARLGGFPTRMPPQSEYLTDVDTASEFPSFDAVAGQLGDVKLAMFNPFEYLRDDLPAATREQYAAVANKTLTQNTREKTLVAIMKVLLLKRLESSVFSFTATLGRTINNIDALLLRIDQHGELAAANPDLDLSRYTPDEDDEETRAILEVGKKLTYKLAHMKLPDWREQLLRDKATLSSLHQRAQHVTPARDQKLLRLQAILTDKASNPSIGKDGLPNRKALVFTAFADTAKYLYEHLAPGLRTSPNIECGLIVGDGGAQTLYPARNRFNEILADFSPVSKRRNATTTAGDEIDVLIATDCISEGQNLQDCDTVINYDIHWNPVRVIQRFGRVDRIGSVAVAVRLINFWPTDQLDKYIKLKDRVEARMALVDIAATQTDNPLSTEQLEDVITDDLKLRDRQLMRLKTEVPNLDEDDESISLADLTLDEFRQDLRQFLDTQRAALASAPLGLFAVVPPDPQIPISMGGVLFCLREKAATPQTTDETSLSPLPNYYVVYVADDGAIKLTHMQAKTILNLWRGLCVGHSEAFTSLCRAFDRQTKNGRDMQGVTAQLQAALASIRSGVHANATQQLTNSRSFKLPAKLETKMQDAGFELVTWLVIQPPSPR